VLRKTSGSSLCYACGKLNRVDASVCFYMPGVNNFAHAGGFVGGYLTGMVVGHGDSRLGDGLHRAAATAAVALTALAFALAVWNAFGA